MYLILPLFATGAVSLAVIVAGLRGAPEAYEDEHGFHVVRKRASGAGVLFRRKWLGVAERGGSQSVIARCASLFAR
jgi:hypothetical protein